MVQCSMSSWLFLLLCGYELSRQREAAVNSRTTKSTYHHYNTLFPFMPAAFYYTTNMEQLPTQQWLVQKVFLICHYLLFICDDKASPKCIKDLNPSRHCFDISMHRESKVMESWRKV